MSLFAKLYETYHFCEEEIGKKKERDAILLPVSHTTQQAQLEVTLDREGNFLRGGVITEKKEMTTIIPCTESSANRTSGPAPHPLFDKLQYVAGDYPRFGTPKPSSFKDCELSYLRQLEEWCASPFAHPKVQAVLTYLRKKRLLADLIEQGLLFCGEDGRLLRKWTGDKEATPPIFRAVPGEQSDAFVRFCVQIPGDRQPELWLDPEVWQSHIDYQTSLQEETDVCFVLGKTIPCASMSPSKIRNVADRAKLISSNDDQGFTSRGRFAHPGDAAKIGYETTQKAHNALKWLIQKQGYTNGDQVVVTWATQNLPVPDLFADSIDLAASEGSPLELIAQFTQQKPLRSLRTEFADRFNKMIAGYGRNLDDCAQVIVLGLDSATPGRLSITFYRELQGSEFLERIQNWHRTCCWLLRYRSLREGTDERGKPVYKRVSFTGAPSPEEITKAAYGENLPDKLKKAAVERLLPCIVDASPLPRDLMLCAARRASNPVAMEDWEADKVLSIACALIRKYYNDIEKQKGNKEVWDVLLQQDQKNRDYLFGRALAYARKIEEFSVFLSQNPDRLTNAERYQLAFSQHPAKTWKLIRHNLHPYLARFHGDTVLHKLGKKYELGMMEVCDRIKPEWMTDEPLSPIYLTGYDSQYLELRRNTKQESEGESEE